MDVSGAAKKGFLQAAVGARGCLATMVLTRAPSPFSCPQRPAISPWGLQRAWRLAHARSPKAVPAALDYNQCFLDGVDVPRRCHACCTSGRRAAVAKSPRPGFAPPPPQEQAERDGSCGMQGAHPGT